jgi:putative FmdB family regulatory protein
MPVYEYRCNTCGQAVSLHYKSYTDYDRATPICPHCRSVDLTRLIRSVSLQSGERNYTRMSSDEMLSVLESGDGRAVGEMFRQAGQNEDKTIEQVKQIQQAKDSAQKKPRSSTSKKP